jgi:hypothetical protein
VQALVQANLLVANKKPVRQQMDTIYTKAHRRLVEAIKQARIAAGLTQAQVAEQLGKPRCWSWFTLNQTDGSSFR